MSSTSETTVPKQDFLWVNHDANNLKPAPQNRQQIFKHVQRKYRPWKRGQETKALRNSAKVPKPKWDSEEATKSSVGDKEAVIEVPTSPKTLIGKGNSDPFAAFALTITPEANRFLTFYRDYILPATYFQIRYKTRATLAKENWQDQVTGLHDVGTGYATLAFHSSTAVRYSPTLRPAALKFMNQSMLSLREKIAKDSVAQEVPYAWHMTVLFAAEVNAANLKNATTHGRMLFNLQKQLFARGKLDYRILLYQLYLDSQLSSMFLMRTIFDVDSWALDFIAPVGKAAARNPQQIVSPDTVLDPSIDTEELQQWFQIRREQLNYVFMRIQQQVTTVSPVITTWRFARTCIFNGRMVHHFLKAEAELRRPGLEQEVKDHLYAQQYLALAGLWHVRDPFMNPILLGRPIYDGTAILVALRKTLELDRGAAEHPFSMSSWDRYKNARLWALYVGALAERAPNTFSAQVVQSLSWFNTNLAEQAAAMGIWTWSAAKVVFDGFLYHESMSALGSDWFELLMTSRAIALPLRDMSTDNAS
ncbi:uncharacterized protein A1O9_07632 [Exophiala aquamarina CBS 119918]|uniref:Uncharacterized protein n=1 Tax=Exophiala aquamarina CBS 119918 TaxID=1182545 RepID=A0A072P850_9EURO|nr:uncharacterized protein A1O9_07632 [Exophiala aquamarina CBS 119918]KEF56051.1 hypothetical protein A1O9_07632 [Exophiala aquamarina CBS 119918]